MKTYATLLALFAALPAAAQQAGPAAPGAAGENAPFSPNEIIHVVQRKPHPFGGKWEASLLGAAQVNGKFTDHIGTGAQLTFHLQENFALLVDGVWYPYAQSTKFSDELLSTASLTPQAANQILLNWVAGAGVEMAPVYGKFAFYDDKLAQFAIYLRATGGVADTRLLAAPAFSEPNPADPSKTLDHAAVYGDTGVKFVGTVGVGVRVYMTDRLALRFEVRDQVLTARISTVNGCSASDLEALSVSGDAASVSASCNKDALADPSATDPKDKYRAAGPASQLIRNPSSDVVNNVAALLGLSFLF